MYCASARAVCCGSPIVPCHRVPLQVLQSATKVSLVRNATWTLSNLCRGKPQSSLASVAEAVPVLGRLLHASDAEVVADALWALSYTSDGPNDRIQCVLDAGCVPRMVQLLSHPAQTVVTPALRGVGNIVTGDDSQTQAVINVGVVPALLPLLSHSKRTVRFCWGGSVRACAPLNSGCLRCAIRFARKHAGRSPTSQQAVRRRSKP